MLCVGKPAGLLVDEDGMSRFHCSKRRAMTDQHPAAFCAAVLRRPVCIHVRIVPPVPCLAVSAPGSVLQGMQEAEELLHMQ